MPHIYLPGILIRCCAKDMLSKQVSEFAYFYGDDSAPFVPFTRLEVCISIRRGTLSGQVRHGLF